MAVDITSKLDKTELSLLKLGRLRKIQISVLNFEHISFSLVNLNTMFGFSITQNLVLKTQSN